MAAEHLRAVTADDLATHHDIVEPGPSPLVRAAVGLALGAGAGLLAVLLTPRDRRRRDGQG